MAVKFTNGINLVGTALQNARMHPVGSNPTDPADGQIWYREDEDRFYGQIDGAAVQLALVSDLATGPVTESDFGANAVLASTTAGAPDSVSLAPSTVLGRDATGNIKALTANQLRTVLNVEDGATADQTGAEIKVAYEAEADTNALTDALKTKLDGIEDGATGDQTDAEILAAVSNVDGPGSGLDADTLDGMEASEFQTVAGMAPFATTAALDTAIADLLGGAGAAYDTLGELQTELQSNDTDIAALLTAIADNSNKFAADVGGSTSITVTHNLGTLDCSVYVRSNITFEMVFCDVTHDGPNSVVLDFAVAPAAAEYRVIVQG